MEPKLRTYVIVRGDLSRSQRAVQAGHALAELSFQAGTRLDERFRQWVEHHKTLVVLKARDLTELEYYRNLAERKEWIYAEFQEPDLDNQPTAIALFPMDYMPTEFQNVALA